MRCFGHILNLVAQAFLYGDDGDSFEREGDIYNIRGDQEGEQDHWRAKGPIGKLHNIAKFIRASPQRTEAFKRYAKELEDQYQISGESTWELEVIQNNSTRWNSTYMMIDRAIKKRNELSSFILQLELAEPSWRLPAADALTADDWKVLTEIRAILEPLYKLTMESQGWGAGTEGGRLWGVLTGMEYLLAHFEEWKVLYDNDPAYLATQVATPGPQGPPRVTSSPASTLP
jgi:hypothetical protein